MNKFSNILLVILLVLVVLNLGFTLLVIERLDNGEVGGDASAEQLDPRISRAWGEKVAGMYNSREHAALYALFGAQARVKISEEQLQAQLEKLHALFGDIEDYAYVNSVKLGDRADVQIFQVLFNLRVSDRPGPATMTLTLVEEGDAYSLYGLRINGAASLD